MHRISLRCHNDHITDHFIRHENFLGEIHKVDTQLEKEDATFLVTDGLAKGKRPSGNLPVVLRAVNPTVSTHVLRHQNNRVKLHEFNPPLTPPGGGIPETPEQKLLRLDATFLAIPGNADPNGVSFRASNPGLSKLFLRHRNFHLFVEEIDLAQDDLGRRDSTFHVEDPFEPGEPAHVN